MRHQLDDPRVEEDPAAERVQYAADDARRRAVGVVRLAHAEADRDPEWGRDPEEDRAEHGDVVVLGRQLDVCQARADTEALERLYSTSQRRCLVEREWRLTVEDEHDEQHPELVVDRERKADEQAVQ